MAHNGANIEALKVSRATTRRIKASRTLRITRPLRASTTRSRVTTRLLKAARTTRSSKVNKMKG